MEIVQKPPYPSRDGYRSAGFGYASDMLHVAVNRDDAVNFMAFLEEAGGLDVECLLAGDIMNYAAIHGAADCVKALFKVRQNWKQPIAYYLDLASKPAYGPNAMRKTVEYAR